MDYFSKNSLRALITEVLGEISGLVNSTNDAIQDINNSIDAIEQDALYASYDNENEMITLSKGVN